jgi:4-hydroxy-4-methyl-2-oxoglutarate aldolase
MNSSHISSSDGQSDAGSPAAAPAEWTWLTSALAADALDAIGLREQCLGHDIRPLVVSQRLIGRAFPVHSVPAIKPNPSMPYSGLMAALDDLVPGSVFVFETGRSDAAGVWGELITTACLASGVAGALTDGLIRDVAVTARSGFPVFSRGATPYDSKGRIDVVAHRQPVTIDCVTIAPGDLIVGDADGVCVIPASTEAEVLGLVAEKRRHEDQFRHSVRNGERVSDAFHRFGVL